MDETNKHLNEMIGMGCFKTSKTMRQKLKDEIDSYDQPERSKREDYNVTIINSYDIPKIEMSIDKDILAKYKWDSIDAVL